MGVTQRKLLKLVLKKTVLVVLLVDAFQHLLETGQQTSPIFICIF